MAVKDSEDSLTTLEDLPTCCEIATEYVELVEALLAKRVRKDIRVTRSYGNTEHKIRYGATAIVDVTESGASLRENGLKIIETIMVSNTVIVANAESLADEEKRFNIESFAHLVNGAAQAMRLIRLTANVPAKVLDEATHILGGLKGPTCSRIHGTDDWFALSSLIPRETSDGQSNEMRVIRQLLGIGVKDIIVERDIPSVMS